MNRLYKVENYQEGEAHFLIMEVLSTGKRSRYNRDADDRGKSGMMKNIRKYCKDCSAINEWQKIKRFMKDNPYVKSHVNERRGDLVGVKKLVEDIIDKKLDIIDKKLEEAEERMMKNMENLFMRFAPIMGKACSNSVISSVPEGKEEEEDDVEDIGEDVKDEDEADIGEDVEDGFDFLAVIRKQEELNDAGSEADEDTEEEEKAEELPDEDIGEDVRDEDEDDIGEDVRDENIYIEDELNEPDYERKWKVKLGYRGVKCSFKFKEGNIWTSLKHEGKKVGKVMMLEVNDKRLSNPEEKGFEEGECKLVKGNNEKVYLAYADDDERDDNPYWKMERVHVFTIKKQFYDLFIEDRDEWKKKPYYCKVNFKGDGRYFDYIGWEEQWYKQDGVNMVFNEDADQLIKYL